MMNKQALGRYDGLVEGEVVPGLIVGASGRKFRGRDVVEFRHPPGMFGTRATGRERQRELTVCNGILNQCSLSDPPTPYWAVLDSMCELKVGFTRAQVIEKAVTLVGEGKRRGCEIAWDVLRNHHRHERKRQSGMAYMVDSLSKGKLAIRARGPGETLQYFLGEGARRKAAEVAMIESPIVEVPIVEGKQDA